MALTFDDVLSAYELLKDYQGDLLGLFPASTGDGVTEWRLIARCSAHGDVWNVITVPEYQGEPSASASVLCPACYELGITRRLAPLLVIKLTVRESV